VPARRLRAWRSMGSGDGERGRVGD